MLKYKRCIGTVAYMGGTPALLEKFSWAFHQLTLYSNEYLVTPDEYIHYDRSKVSYHAKARNELVAAMQGEWILMLDSDHEPEPDLLARMLQLYRKYKLEVLVGLYQVKMFPYPPLLYQWNEDHTDFELISSFDNPDKADIFQIAAAGAGCLMISRMTIYRILNELKERTFDVTIQQEGKLPLSEDLSFFKRCDKLGIKIYAAAKIENPHLEIAPITMDMNIKASKSGYETEQKITEGLKK